jgi:DNA-binding response OmpR family regulator
VPSKVIEQKGNVGQPSWRTSWRIGRGGPRGHCSDYVPAHAFTAWRILVVEDVAILAFGVADILKRVGAQIVGPALELEAADRFAEEEGLSGALLDIRLSGDEVWSVARLLDNLIKAGSAREALEHLLKSEIAVVLTDVSMPDLDGFQLAAMLREHPRFENTAIIFVSAIQLADLDRLRGFNLGAIDYITVPVAPALLRAKVKAPDRCPAAFAHSSTVDSRCRTRRAVSGLVVQMGLRTLRMSAAVMSLTRLLPMWGKA